MKRRMFIGVIVFLTIVFSIRTPGVFAQADLNEVIFYSQPGAGARSQIYSVRSDGTGQLNISNDPFNWHSYPSWAPGGSSVVFSRNGDIWTMDTKGLNGTKVANGGAAGAINPVLSPRGDSIAYIYDGNGFQAASILLFSFQSGLTSLTDIGPQDSSGREWDYRIDWSPDGTKLVFTRVESDNRRSNIYAVNADGSGELALTESADLEFNMDPSWSPDGSKIVFRSPGGISIMNADGTDMHEIATLTHARHPSWSSDGSQIVFSARTEGDAFLNVYKMDSNGSNLIKLTNNPFDSLGPRWKLSSTVSITGRVLTPGGQGLRNTIVTITDGAGARRSTTTSTLGYYSFDDIEAGQTVTISAASRRYRFESITRSFSDSLTEIDLVGTE